LLVENVDVSFGGLAVLRDVSVAAKPGRITGIIGPNGAGKTTLFNAMSGFVRPQRGRISLNGTEIVGLAPASLHALGLGRTFQSGQVFGELTVLDNLLGSYGMHSFGLVLQDLLGLPGARRRRLAAEHEARTMATALGLSDFLHEPAGSLSAGLQKLVDVGRALVQQPQVVLLDEPVAGLREDERANMANVIREIAQDGDRGVVLVEHDMRFVMSLCEVVYVLHLGEIIAYGHPESVQQDTRVRQAYLGTGDDGDRSPEAK
jgi:branched-chain amino acid transport system ATP-binding protein